MNLNATRHKENSKYASIYFDDNRVCSMTQNFSIHLKLLRIENLSYSVKLNFHIFFISLLVEVRGCVGSGA